MKLITHDLTQNKQFFLLIYFQIVWLLIAWGGLNNQFALPAALSLLSWFFFLRLAKPKKQKLLTLVGLGLLGFLVDFVLIQFHFYSFNKNQSQILGMPIWFILIWVLYSSVHGIYLNLLNRLTALGGSFVFGLLTPLSYFAAQKLGLIQFEYSKAYIVLSVFWFLYFFISSKVIQFQKEHL